MAAVAAIAVFLSLPATGRCVWAVVAILVLIPAVLAPEGRKAEVAIWAMSLHPLVILAWVAAGHLVLNACNFHEQEAFALLGLVVYAPYLIAAYSLGYMPILVVTAWAVAAYVYPKRSYPTPLVFMSVTWLANASVIIWAPFRF